MQNLHCKRSYMKTDFGTFEYRSTFPILKRLQCKFAIVPEEGWTFGQVKHSPSKKIIQRCIGSCLSAHCFLLFLFFIADQINILIQYTPPQKSSTFAYIIMMMFIQFWLMLLLIWLFTVFYRAWHRDVPSSFRTCSAIILGFKPITT